MPYEYCRVVEEWVKQNQVSQTRVSIIGLSFKSDTDDLRYTPMVEVYKKLKNSFTLKIFDPIVDPNDFGKVVGETIVYADLKDCFDDANVVILGCAHKEIKQKDILKYSKNLNKKFIIVDGRGGYPELRKILSKDQYIKI